MKGVTVGNGNKLNIARVGNSYLTNGITTLKLKDILCVIEIAKNLVSVSKLAQDNKIFIEFHGDFCLVKDNDSDQTVLIAMLKDSLYQLEIVKTNVVDKPNLKNSIMEKSRREEIDPSIFVLSNTSVNVVVPKFV